MTKLNWLGLGLIGVAGVALPKALSFAEYALSNPTTLSSRNSGSVQANDSSQLVVRSSQLGNNNSELETPNSELSSPRRLTVTVRVARPEDLKVQEGDNIKAGQVIADRERERSRVASAFGSALQLPETTVTTIPPAPPILYHHATYPTATGPSSEGVTTRQLQRTSGRD